MLPLGNKIQRMRVWRGITQTELASGLVTPSMISQIEANKANPSTELLLKIIEKLGISVETFLKDVYLDLGGRGLYRFALDLMEYEQYAAALQFFKQLEDRPNIVDSNDLQFQIAVCLQNTGHVPEAIEQLDIVLSQVQGSEYREFTGKILYQLANAYYKQHNLSLAFFYANKSDLIMNDLSDVEQFTKARIKSLLGIISSRFGHYEKAIEYHKVAFEYYQPNHPEKVAGMLTNLGIEYKNLGNYKRAKEYFEQSLEVFNNISPSKESIVSKYNYGVLLGVTAEYELALNVLQECLVEYGKYGLSEKAPMVYSEMAQIELNRGKLEEAKTFVLQGIENSAEEHHERAYLYKIMADVYNQLGEYKEAITYLERSIPIYQKYSRYADLVSMLPLLSKCYEQLGDVENAVATLEKSKEFMKNLL